MDELSREKVERMFGVGNGFKLSVWPFELQPVTAQALLTHDAALRASRDAERERAEKAEKEAFALAATQCEQPRAGEGGSMYCQTIADLTAKLEAMTQDYETAKHIISVTGDEWGKCKQQLADSEQRVKELEECTLLQNTRYNEMEQSRHDLIGKLAEAQATITRLERLVKQADSSYELYELVRSERDQLQATIARLEGEIEGITQDYTQKLNGATEKLDEAEAERDQLQATVTAQQEEIKGLRETLEYYANPNTYHACSFFIEPPTGGFGDDFDEGHEGYDRPMPGKSARQALAAKGWPGEAK